MVATAYNLPFKVRHDGVAQVQAITAFLPPIEEREKLIKALVVGAMPQQANSLSQDYSKLLNLRFWLQEGPRTLKNLVRSSKLIVLMADKIGHSVQDTVKRYKSDDCDLLIVSGSVSNIKVAIDRYLS